MDPQTQCCPNRECPARGLVGTGNIRVHRWPEQGDRCTGCGRTFAATMGTMFYRHSTDPALITGVLTLLVHGCPPQAIEDRRVVGDRVGSAGSNQLHPTYPRRQTFHSPASYTAATHWRLSLPHRRCPAP
jgi:hypothetical protein